ncbi:MAG TPA: PQQ-binding-like beta-propeller repeat protein [Rhodanobacteraceae bacterium]|nr:PQQ-binding-like beta-propeller repeat protein [Rhodanobacteraceae bacterium]
MVDNVGRTIAVLALMVGGIFENAYATDWLQFGYDQAHSGFNRAERGYPTPNGNRVLYHYALPGSAGLVDSAPVYLSNVATTSGSRNVLFLVSKNGTLLALDADSQSLDVLWSKRPLGTGLVTNGSAAIDPDRLHVYAFGLDGKVHKYQVGDGTEVTSAGWPQVSTLKPDQEKGSAGLSIATAQNGKSYLYSVVSGYVDDTNDYQGHVTAIDLTTGAQTVFNAQCSSLTIHFVANGITSGAGQNDCMRIGGGNSGTWGRPGTLYDAVTNRLFFTTGNGDFDPGNAKGHGMDWGDTVLALNPDGTGGGAGMPVDSYTPTTYGSDSPQVGLEGFDADLGAVTLALIPPPPGTSASYQHLAVQGGKDGCLRLLNIANLSGQGGPAHVGGELQAINFPGGVNCATGQDGPEIKSQPAVWVNPADHSTWLYVTTEFAGMAAYKIVLDGSGKPSLSLKWTGNNATSPIVANGVVYMTSDARLYAYDAVSGAPLVDDTSAWATTLFNDTHWQSPIVVDGKIYVVDGVSPTAESQLWVYELDGLFHTKFD